MCSQYYKNKDANILIDSAKQYQSMDANEEQNLLAKKTQAYQNMASCEKEKLFEKQTNLRSTAQHTKLLKCNVLGFLYQFLSKQNQRRPVLHMFCVQQNGDTIEEY